MPEVSAGLSQGGFSPEQVEQLIRDPRLRPQDHPEFVNVGRQLIIEPNDLYLQEYFGQLLGRRLESATETEDVFYAKYPPKRAQLTDEPAIWAGCMGFTGDSLPLPLSRSSSGTAITGLPGAGKTTLAMILVVLLVLAGALVIVWDIKGTWLKLLNVASLGGRLIALSIRNFMRAVLQPPPGTTAHEWANRFTNVFAQAYGRVSAQRILREVIDELLSVCPPGYWPTPKMIIDRLKSFPGKSLRDREYVSSVLWALVDMVNHFPGVFSYTSSDMSERLFSEGGRLFIVEDCGLPVQHWNFAFCLETEYVFTLQRNNPDQRKFDIVMLLEDSTSLLDPGQDQATPGGVSLLAQNLNTCREMRIGIMPICHSLGQISPKVRCNIENYFCCSLRGDNLGLAQQVLGITAEQAEFLRVNPRGTACALIPSVWPLPVLIGFPPIMEHLK